MHKTKLSLCALLCAATAPCQVDVTAQLAAGQVTTATSTSAPIVSGTDIWSGFARATTPGADQASLEMAHGIDSQNVRMHWQLQAQANASGPSVSRGEARYELASPILQSGNLEIEWLPATTGTGQATLAIDVYDDGYVDAHGTATIPVVFGTGFPLTLRVTAEASADAGTIHGPWGTSWSWFGSAAGELRVRFVPTHATSTVVVAQPCATAPTLTSTPDLHEGVELEGDCGPTDVLAVFALGFQSTDVLLPLSANCRLLVAPVVTQLHPVAFGTAVRQPVAVPAAVRPVQFLAQLVTLTAAGNITAGSLVQTSL